MALTLAEREEISRAVAAGQSIRSIAARLGRAPSTVSREIKRNGGRGELSGDSSRPGRLGSGTSSQGCKLAENRALARIVTDKLRMLWSPEQIAGWLKHTYPRDESHHVSHETIYRSLFIQARGALKKELLQHLRRTRGMRRSRHYTQKTDDPRQDRRRRVDQRASSCRRRSSGARSLGRRLAVRQSQQPDRHAGRAADAIRDAGEGCEQGHADGRQRAHQERAQAASGALQVTDLGPRHRRWPATSASRWPPTSRSTSAIRSSPWQRGSNENTNGLLRQYLPKGIDISSYSQAKLNAVARQLNERPRKTLGFQTPAEMFSQSVALTG